MGLHWVKAKNTIRTYDGHGHAVIYYAGDWFQVRNMEMRLLLDSGQIEVPLRIVKTALDTGDSGVLVIGGDFNKAKEHLSVLGDIQVKQGAPALPFPRTLLWDASIPLRTDLVSVGFHRLSAGWQVAAPLFSYGKLARDIGTPEERELTAEIIHDLRVPVYDTRTVYVRRCPDTERLIKLWIKERQRGNDDRLAFHRALYQTKPVMCALPITWTYTSGQL